VAISNKPDDAAADLAFAVMALCEATGCEESVATDIVDSIARYAIRKAQGCLPAGWGRRGG
jgi:hypothetical protein